MTLAELTALCIQAESDPWEFFAVHTLKDMLKAAHPDKWPSDKPAHSLFIRFQAAGKLAESPKQFVGKYPLNSLVYEGDLRKVYRSTDGVLVKVPTIREKEADNLILKEKKILDLTKSSSKDNIIQYFFPHMVDSIEYDDTIVNVTIYDRKLHTAAEIKKVYPNGVDSKHLAWMMRRMFTGVGYLHSLGYVHGAITPEHVMFGAENHCGVITGMIHADKVGEKLSVVPASRVDWYPDFAKKGLTTDLDCHMIGRLSEFLSDDKMPTRFRRFVKNLKNVRGVSLDVLDTDLKEILFECYGAPKFIDLVI